MLLLHVYQFKISQKSEHDGAYICVLTHNFNWQAKCDMRYASFHFNYIVVTLRGSKVCTDQALLLKVRDQITFLTPQLSSKFLRFWYQ